MTKWGIIGLGNIASKFAADLLLSDDALLQGVASRDINKAENFAKKYKANNYYSSYEEMLKDPEIDVVYIATPHVFHFEHTMLSLKHNKSVLCEKPMGMNSQEVKTMISEAKTRNKFLMEAIWTRFIPSTQKVLDLIESDAIGDPIIVKADFGFKSNHSIESRVFDKKLGAGALLDIGIYPIYLSLLTLGVPTDIKAIARMTNTDVDAYSSMLFDYKNKAKALLESTIEADTPTEGFIYGTKGSIKLHKQFHHCKELTVISEGKEENIKIDYIGNGYYHEIEEVHKCLANGEIESSKVNHRTSIELIEILDRVRVEIGLEY